MQKGFATEFFVVFFGVCIKSSQPDFKSCDIKENVVYNGKERRRKNEE